MGTLLSSLGSILAQLLATLLTHLGAEKRKDEQRVSDVKSGADQAALAGAEEALGRAEVAAEVRSEHATTEQVTEAIVDKATVTEKSTAWRGALFPLALLAVLPTLLAGCSLTGQALPPPVVQVTSPGSSGCEWAAPILLSDVSELSLRIAEEPMPEVAADLERVRQLPNVSPRTIAVLEIAAEAVPEAGADRRKIRDYAVARGRVCK